MKKLIALMLSMVLVFCLAGCGDSDSIDVAPSVGSGEVQMVTMNFGDISVNLPDSFEAVTESSGYYVSVGPDAVISVSAAQPIALAPSDWDEQFVQDSLEALYGATYSNIQFAAFQGEYDLNGSSAIYFAFTGVNASGVERLSQVIYLYDADNQVQYEISFAQSVDNAVITDEVSGEIINSVKLN